MYTTVDQFNKNTDVVVENSWLNVQQYFKKEFGLDVYNTWLYKLHLVEINNSEMILSVPTTFIKDWINREYLNGIQKIVDGDKIWVKKGIKQIVQQLYPEIKNIELIIDKNQTVENIIIEEKTENNNVVDNGKNIVSISEHNNLYNIGTELNNKYTFENFVVGASNKLAYSVCKTIVENDGFEMDTNPLFLYGGVGLGKTHLCQAIAWKLKDKFPNKQIIYLSAEKFMYLFVQSLQNQDINTFKAKFRNIDVLIIDDIHFIAGKESTQKEFFQTFNTLISENKQIILACDRSPLNLEKIDEQLKSRMSGGIIVDLFEPDYDLRLNLVKFKSQQMGLNLSEKVSELLSEKLVTNGREIEGCLKRLLMQQKFMNIEITKKVVEEILVDNIQKAQKIINIDSIQEKVSEYFNISMADLKSDKRLKELVIPRHIAMYFCKKLTQKSLPDIAKKFGGKNHATVIHAVRKIEELIENDREINEIITKLTNIINA